MRTNRYGRKKTVTNLASKLNLKGIEISAITVFQIFKKAGFKKIKLIRKLRLIKKIKDNCL